MSFRDQCEHHAEVETTMAVARERAMRGAADGTTIVAGAQTGGRGRLGRSWFSPVGAGLWATVILRPTARPDGSLITMLGLVCGVAACQAARQLGAAQAMLKWPNDVVVADRKLCGILTESSDAQGPAPIALVGFGLNVAPRAALTLPADLTQRYVGLGDLVHEGGVTPETALPVLLDAVETWYRRWLSGGATPIVAAWRELDALYGLDVEAEPVAGKRLVGRANSIADNGALRVLTPQGEAQIIAGDVLRVRRAGGG